MLWSAFYFIGHTASPEDVIVKRIRSTGFIVALAPEERERIEDEVKTLIAEEPTLSGREVVTMPYETAAFHTVNGG